MQFHFFEHLEFRGQHLNLQQLFTIAVPVQVNLYLNTQRMYYQKDIFFYDISDEIASLSPGFQILFIQQTVSSSQLVSRALYYANTGSSLFQL